MKESEEFLFRLTTKGKHLGAQQISLMFAMLCWENMENQNETVPEIIERLYAKTIAFCESVIEEGNEKEIGSAKEIKELTENQYKAWKKAVASS